ncbi:hypothetical protein ACFL6L_00025 [candidate division KSB1 bacterium]
MRLNSVQRMSVVLILLLFTAVDFAPAQDDTPPALIKEVQARIKSIYDNIESVTFSGQTRYFDYIGSDFAQLNTVVDFEDCYFDGIWIRPDSMQIVVRAFRSVDPEDADRNYFWEDMPLPNPMQFSFSTSITPLANASLTTENPENGTKTDVRLMTLWPVFPFAPDADSLYNYTIISEIGMGFHKIIEVQVTTKSDGPRGVSGIFQIDAVTKDIVGWRYEFNDAKDIMKKLLTAAKFPMYTRHFIDFDATYTVTTKRALVNGVYWLPEKITEDAIIKMLGAKMSFQREIEFTSYFINQTPEEILAGPDTRRHPREEVIFLKDSLLESTVFPEITDGRKLTRKEETRLIRSVEDKLIAMEMNAKKMTLEQKGRKFYTQAEWVIGDFFLYNRVEGIRPFYNAEFTDILLSNSMLTAAVGYGIQDKRWKGDISCLKFLDAKRNYFIEGNIYRTTGYEESAEKISTPKNTFTSLALKTDYRDFYYTTGGKLSLGHKVSDNLEFTLTGITQREQSASNHASFGILNWERPFRLNPEIHEGTFNGIRSSLQFRNYTTSLNITAEYTDKDFLKSDFSYRSIKSDFRHMYEPDYTNTFTLTLTGAASSGALAPQRWFDFGGRVFMDYYGNLRGTGYKAFTGDRMAAGLLEYSFSHGTVWDALTKSTLLEKAIRMTKVNFWTGMGWSELSDRSLALASGKNIPARTTDGVYRETGVGIGDRFGVIRFDFVTNNTGDKSLLFSFNFMR